MISSEGLAEKFGQSRPKKTTTILQRGTYQPVVQTSSSVLPTAATAHASASQPRSLTRIITKKLPPPPHYTPPTILPLQATNATVANNTVPNFSTLQDTIPRSLAFKFMRWMRLGQDVIHIEEEEETGSLQKTREQSSDALPLDINEVESKTESVAQLLDASTLQADGEIEHAALREAASNHQDIPLEEVVEETKSRWRSFGRRAVAKSVLPIIEYSAAAALKSFKNKRPDSAAEAIHDEPYTDYDPEVIEATVDSLLEDVKKSRRVSKKNLLRHGAQSHLGAARLKIDDNKRYIDNIQTLYSVSRDKAADMIRSAIAAAKSDPKGPKIIELHDGDSNEEVFGVKIRVEGGPAISFAPTDIHARLKPYIAR